MTAQAVNTAALLQLEEPERVKLASLQVLAERDSRHGEVIELSRLLDIIARRTADRDLSYVQLVTALVKDCIQYQSDAARTGGEDIAGLTRGPEPPLTPLERGTEDCDGKARLWVALLRARGFAAEVAPLPREGRLAHVYGRVQFRGRVLPQELTLKRAILGEEPLAVPKERDGKWLKT